MCGFAGFWEFKPTMGIKSVLQNMLSPIQQRGPDSSGTWANNHFGIGLGHQRLSIIDLSDLGSQPMISESKRFVIAYNGEIYNAKELKKEFNLKTKGHSDTEVLLELCATYGVRKTLSKCIGMFSFALWDNELNKLHLARDRLGIKPIYWGFNQGILYFGSEIKSFYYHPKWNPELNHNSIANFLSFNYISGSKSIIKNIQKVEPGTIITVNIERKVTYEKYWDFKEVSKQLKTDISIDKYLQGLEEKLLLAIQRRMISDVPLGAFLSGGIDSSLVVTMMKKLSSNVKTFTIGFQDSQYNEANYAKSIAKFLDTEHYEHYLTEKQAQDIIFDLPNMYDEPFADSSQIPTYLISKIAKEKVTVALSGDGGDELFAGYNKHIFTSKYWNLLSITPSFLKNFFYKIIHSLSIESWNKIPLLNRNTNFLGEKLYKLSPALKENDIISFYHRVAELWPSPHSLLKEKAQDFIFEDIEMSSDVSTMQYLDTAYYLPNDILTKVDRASMAVSLEVRVPLLDHEIVEYAWRLPDRYKIYKNQAKWPLYKILSKHLPQKLIERPKMGFGIPVGKWLRNELKELMLDFLSEEAIQKTGILNSRQIHSRVKEHLSGERNWDHSLWGVLMLQMWLYNHFSKNKKEFKHAAL